MCESSDREAKEKSEAGVKAEEEAKTKSKAEPRAVTFKVKAKSTQVQSSSCRSCSSGTHFMSSSHFPLLCAFKIQEKASEEDSTQQSTTQENSVQTNGKHAKSVVPLEMHTH